MPAPASCPAPVLHVMPHAVERYRERVGDPGSDAAILAVLTGPVVQQAARFGCPYVRLGTGQRIVLDGWRVVTVLPREHHAGRLYPGRAYASNLPRKSLPC